MLRMGTDNVHACLGTVGSTNCTVTLLQAIIRLPGPRILQGASADPGPASIQQNTYDPKVKDADKRAKKEMARR